VTKRWISATDEDLDEVRMVVPTGCLGYGFDLEDFTRAVDEFAPHVIAVDAGSTDPGPYYLGVGEPFTNRLEVKAELEHIIGAGIRGQAAVIVGSSGGAGADAHVAWTREIVLELADENDWHFELATISSQVDAEYVVEKLRSDGIRTFESAVELDEQTVFETSPIVAQMGPEPIAAALEGGAQVILAGRSCDDAIFAALPILRGFDKGLALHLGKILECGALASEPIAMDVMAGVLRRDYFEIVPGSQRRACTPTSVAGHSLYEREHPLVQEGPGGAVDLTATAIEQRDPRRVRVSGTRHVPATDYTVKLEGVRLRGYRTICIAGMRCPSALRQLDDLLGEAERRTRDYFADFVRLEDEFDIVFHVYGRDGVMRELEPLRAVGHEVGLVLDVVAKSQELAHTACHHLSGVLLHLDFPGQYNNAGNLAFPYSPSEIDVGPVYEFSIYHLMALSDPLEPFRIEFEPVGTSARVASSAMQAMPSAGV
jgi:hypothetical protein